MKKLLELLGSHMSLAFEKAGFSGEFGRVTVSNRPDLCEFQCSGCMAGAKINGMKPMDMAVQVSGIFANTDMVKDVEAIAPGFINFNIREDALAHYLGDMAASDAFGLEAPETGKKIIIDYGGPNVAKPLHVGHLRSAVIGESIKRIKRYCGHKVTGDIHLGDWGLQMGLIMAQLEEEQPGLSYFTGDGDYPEEAPFTILMLEEIYPRASARSKEDEAFKERAMDYTKRLQEGDPACRHLWKHIINVSVSDLKKNYNRLKVSFDLWNGESDVQDEIAPMVEKMKKEGHAYVSEGALVVDVSREDDKKEIPPCMILKSDGAALYSTTDLATILCRMRDHGPDEIIYVVDKRQSLHFQQVFRCALKTGLVTGVTGLHFIGFGTMNGRDGKPYKTREGGVMRLESLLAEIHDEMYKKIITERTDMTAEEADTVAEKIALAAVKYGDLSNQASKDYNFDIDRFTSFEGDTGPYILYTIVRIKSILGRYAESGGDSAVLSLVGAETAAEKKLMLALTGFHQMMEQADTEMAPHKICAYIFDLANVFNSFYHETNILNAEQGPHRDSMLALLLLTRRVLETCTDLLGFDAPERM